MRTLQVAGAFWSRGDGGGRGGPTEGVATGLLSPLRAASGFSGFPPCPSEWTLCPAQQTAALPRAAPHRDPGAAEDWHNPCEIVRRGRVMELAASNPSPSPPAPAVGTQGAMSNPLSSLTLLSLLTACVDPPATKGGGGGSPAPDEVGGSGETGDTGEVEDSGETGGSGDGGDGTSVDTDGDGVVDADDPAPEPTFQPPRGHNPRFSPARA